MLLLYSKKKKKKMNNRKRLVLLICIQKYINKQVYDEITLHGVLTSGKLMKVVLGLNQLFNFH